MADGLEERAQAQGTASGFLRISAVILAFLAIAYAMREMWTAAALSSAAPLGWRAQLLLLEGGAPILLALGFGAAAWGTQPIRRAGWGLVIAVVLFIIAWSWLVVRVYPSVHPSVTGHVILRPIVLMTLLDPAARRRLVEAAGRNYSASLFAFAVRCGASWGIDATLAQDAVQDIFVALLNGKGESDQVLQKDASQLKAYLFSAVQLRIMTIVRGEGRRSVNEGYFAVAVADGMAPSPADLYDATELQECIDKALSKCPARAVHAYRLVHECDMTYRQAGEVMGIASQTVGSHVSLVAKRIHTVVNSWQSSASEDVS
jgi:RNA polymerase sigma factor (sigma-70 family)